MCDPSRDSPVESFDILYGVSRKLSISTSQIVGAGNGGWDPKPVNIL